MTLPDLSSLLPVLQTLIVATFGYVAHLLRDIRKELSTLSTALLNMERRYEKHEVQVDGERRRYDDRMRDFDRRVERVERHAFGGNGEG